MANVIVSLIILAIIGLAISRVLFEKRRGSKCVGCPMSGECTSKKSSTISNRPMQQIAIKELT